MNPDQKSQLFTFIEDSPGSEIREGLRLRQQHVSERLIQLKKMDLAQSVGPSMWHVRRDFESVLRAMQRMSDRQKMLAAHGTPISDERLPMTVLDYRKLTSLDGRVLVHGEEEVGREAGRSYLMLEGTDARVHHIYYTPEMERARSDGGLKTNSFVRLRKLFVDNHPSLEIEELGDAETLLSNRHWLRGTAKKLIKRSIIPEEDGWGGWLGRYQAALRKVVLEELDRKQRNQNLTRAQEQGR